MNSQKLLIISLIAALLIIGSAVAVVKFRNSAATGSTNATADHVVIDEILASCKPNDKCIVVDTTCSFCCNYMAINAKSEVLFNQMFDQTCKTYKGSYCECHDLSSYPACVNGTCQMVKWSENKQPPRARAPVAVPAPAAPTATEIPYTAPEPVPVPTPTTPPPVQQPAIKAFGEDDAATAAPAPADDLYEPLPEKLTPLETLDDNGVEVIQP